jgi:ABC-2 type transport system ATP-binding protein
MTGSQRTPVLELRNVAKSFGDELVVADVSFTVERGEVVALTGPNGSGKSTVLQCAVGWQEPSSGEVLFDGLPYRDQRAETRAAVAVALGAGADFPGLTVREHLELMARAHGDAGPGVLVASVLAELDLSHVAEHFPFALSQGQRRRLGLASCFVRPRRLIVLDEPEQNLDRRGRAWLAERIEDERSAGVAVLMACHDSALVDAVADSEVEFRFDWPDSERDGDSGPDGRGSRPGR